MIEKLQKIYAHFGEIEQLEKKLPEELEELRIELCRPHTDKLIIDEMADVFVMILQIAISKGWAFKLYNRIKFKINRTLERIDSGYYEKEKK